MWSSRQVANVGEVIVLESAPGFIEETLGARKGFFIKGWGQRYDSLAEALAQAAEIAKHRKR